MAVKTFSTEKQLSVSACGITRHGLEEETMSNLRFCFLVCNLSVCGYGVSMAFG